MVFDCMGRVRSNSSFQARMQAQPTRCSAMHASVAFPYCSPGSEAFWGLRTVWCFGDTGQCVEAPPTTTFITVTIKTRVALIPDYIFMHV